MAHAAYSRTSFLGGEWSKYAQGRWDRPEYASALNVCLNAFPVEQGAWVRRPGTQFAGATRRGQRGRVVTFDFQAVSPYLIEFTDGFLRFRAGTTLVTTNDDQSVSTISAATPAVVTTVNNHGWTGTISVKFTGSGIPVGLLNRVFIGTVTGNKTIALADDISGQNINGATVGSLGTCSVQRLLEVASPYTGLLWQTVRLVQTETQAILLHGSVPPYVLTAVAPGAGQTYYSFTLAAASYTDGPYLDPPTNGALLSPSAVNGNITLTVLFTAYVAAKSYSKGDFVSNVGVNYKSLTDQNQNNTPASSPTQWAVVNSGVAIGPNGFVGTDIGRYVRLQDSGGSWTWGKITGIGNLISGALGGSTNIGNMTLLGGLAAAFDGQTAQSSNVCAAAQVTSTNPVQTYVGKNYSGATAQKIAGATFWPSTDLGAYSGNKTYTQLQQNFQAQVVSSTNQWVGSSSTSTQSTVAMTTLGITFNLRAKQTAPANSADGTLLGSISYTGGVNPFTIISSDQTTAWLFVWIEVVITPDTSIPANGADNRVPNPPSNAQVTAGTIVTNTSYTLNSYIVSDYCAEAQFFAPVAGGGGGNQVNFQILGPALANTTATPAWRLGLFSNTTGWPTCGTYHEGRLWLAGSVGNRLDGSYANQIFNFTPTGTTGVVTDANAIAAIFSASDVNTIFWLVTDALGIIVGTLAGDWLVQASANNLPLTPTSIQAHRFSKMGVANIEPKRADHTLILIQRYRRKMFEYFADVYSGKFGAQNVTWATRHMAKAGIAEIAYQQELAPIIWARCDDGSFFGLTYKRESNVSSQPANFSAGHRHTLGSGRTVESICVGPSPDGTLDSLAMVTSNAAGIRHVEVLTPLFEESNAETAAWFLDDAVTLPVTTTSSVTPSPFGGLTIYGLSHLEGQTVTVFCGGLDCGDWLVSGGQITVTYGDGISDGTGSGLFTATFAAGATIVVGMTYTSDGQITRPVTPQETGARDGPALGKVRRGHKFAALLDTCGPISFGTRFDKLFPALFRNPDRTNLTAGQTFSGVHKDTLQDNISFDGMLCWRVTRPYSATVVAVEPMLQTQDE